MSAQLTTSSFPSLTEPHVTDNPPAEAIPCRDRPCTGHAPATHQCLSIGTDHPTSADHSSLDPNLPGRGKSYILLAVPRAPHQLQSDGERTRTIAGDIR